MMTNRLTKFCQRCLYGDDHPLGLIIDESGICSGCRIHEEKDTLNWKDRYELLEKIIQPYKQVNKKNYDCIIPVSGGMDSYFIVDVVKNKLKLNPLLVTYNKYFNTPLGIRNLANLRIKFDCDIIQQNTNPLSVKKITRHTLQNYGNIYWHCIAGQTVFPVQIACHYKIPLIIWGAHQGTEQVGMFSHLHEVEMSRRYRKDHDLFGVEADDLLSNFGTIQEKDVSQFRYPDDQSLAEVGVRGIYLSNYIRWDPKAQHESMIKKYDFRTSKFSRTIDAYDFVDCFNYMNLHDLLKLYKHGYSKVTDHVSREIRHKRLSRNQGHKLVLKHEHQAAEFSNLFCSWLGVNEKSLNFILNTFKNLKYWDHTYENKSKFHGWSSIRDLDSSQKASAKLDAQSKFIVNGKLGHKHGNRYITIGKGYP